MSDVRRYIVVRAVAALTVTFSLAQVLSAGATLITDDIAATAVPVPATKGSGNFIGVAAVGSSGLLSDWSWGSDTVAPPYPDTAAVVMYEVAEGIAYQVPDSSNSYNAQTNALVSLASHKDPGFAEYILLVSGSSNGSSATIAGRSSNSADTIPVEGGVTGWYKLVASDKSGNYVNSAAPNNAGYATGWKFIFSRYAELGLPPNGNFQVPNETDTDAKGWAIVPDASAPGTYVTSGGLEGNRAYRFTVPAIGVGGGIIVIQSSLSRLLPARTTATGEVWVYQDSGVTQRVAAQVYFQGYPNDDGSGSAGGYFFVYNISYVTVPTGTWTRITLGTLSDSLSGTDRSGVYYIDVGITPHAGASANPYYLHIDAAKLIFS